MTAALFAVKETKSSSCERVEGFMLDQAIESHQEGHRSPMPYLSLCCCVGGLWTHNLMGSIGLLSITVIFVVAMALTMIFFSHEQEGYEPTAALLLYGVPEESLR
jgi:hypothetical protein